LAVSRSPVQGALVLLLDVLSIRSIVLEVNSELGPAKGSKKLGSITVIFNSVQLFIIYVPSQQLQGQLQTQHGVDTRNYSTDKHNIKSKANYRQALEEKHINAEKYTK
jgi:hypothetical protein